MIKRLCIIGVGLIGGSLARALKAAGAVREIVGCGRDPVRLQRAVDLGVIDRYTEALSEGVRGADVVVLATPVGTMEPIFRELAPHLVSGAILTDAGSTKGSVVEAARAVFGRLPAGFVPAHPIAGTEKSGVEASFPELFQGRRVILTPLAETDPAAVAQVRRMWTAAGAQVEEMEVEHHDRIFAATSHLPHLLAFGLVDSLARRDPEGEVFRYAAGGFRDFTRIASSDPQMWHDICLANRTAILQSLADYTRDLAELARAINDGNGDYLLETFSRAKSARDRFCSTLEDMSDPREERS